MRSIISKLFGAARLHENCFQIFFRVIRGLNIYRCLWDPCGLLGITVTAPEALEVFGAVARGFLPRDKEVFRYRYSNRKSREKIPKTIFLKPGGPKKFGNDKSHRCDRFCQIFVQIGAILTIFRPFENLLAV